MKIVQYRSKSGKIWEEEELVPVIDKVITYLIWAFVGLSVVFFSIGWQLVFSRNVPLMLLSVVFMAITMVLSGLTGVTLANRDKIVAITLLRMKVEEPRRGED